MWTFWTSGEGALAAKGNMEWVTPWFTARGNYSYREDFLSLAEGRMRLFDAFVENNTVEKAAKSTLLHYRENRLASEESLFAMRDFFLRAAKFIFK